MFSLRKKYLQLPLQGHRTFWSLLTLAVALGVFSFQVIPELLYSHTPQEVIANGLPPALCLLAILGAGLVLGGHIFLGGILLITGLWIGMLLAPALAAGYGFVAAAIAFLIPTYLFGLILPISRLGLAQMTSMLVGTIILLLDAFWPGQRIPADAADVNAATLIVLALLGVYALFMARSFPAYPLRTKLIMAFMAMAVIPMGLVAFFNNRATSEALTHDANQTLMAAASQTATSLDDFLQSSLDGLRVEAQNPDFVDYLKLWPERRAGSEAEGKVKKILQILCRKDTIYIRSYALLDTTGKNVADSFAGDISADEMGMDYFVQPGLTGLPFVSPVRISTTSSEVSLYFSAPVRNEAGDVIGVLRARYNADILQKIVVKSSELLSSQSSVLLVDDTNILLGHSSEPGSVYKSIVRLDDLTADFLTGNLRLRRLPLEELSIDLPVLANGLANASTKPNFITTIHPEGKSDAANPDEQAGAIRLSVQPWWVIVATPQDLLLAPVYMQARNTLLIGVIIAMIAIIAGSLISQLLSRPIQKLTEAANRIAKGEMEELVQINAQDETGTLAATFNTMMVQIKSLIATLEQRVADRTRALEISAEVSRRLSTILDQDRLVKEVVDQVQAAFGYYHAHIYLFDEKGEYLVMTGGTGEVGQALLGRGHKIPRGRGLVGRTAETNRPVLVADVKLDPYWLPNLLLPETRCEVAVPIAVGNQVLGVLDVQHNIVDGLGKLDADLLQSIANQVAVAVQNARAYTRAQQQAEREALVASIGRRIQSAMAVDDVMQIGLNELGQALRATRARAELGVSHDLAAHASYEELG